MHLMEVHETAAPERFRYCDLKEAFTLGAPYGDSIGRARLGASSAVCWGRQLRRNVACVGSPVQPLERWLW